MVHEGVYDSLMFTYVGKEETMQDRKYLLSLQELFGEKYEENVEQQDMAKQQDELCNKVLEELRAKVSDKLDSERLKKLEHIKRGRKQIESIGAGLLLQLAVREAVAESVSTQGKDAQTAKEHTREIQAVKEQITGEDLGKAGAIKQLSLTQLLAGLEGQKAPLPLEYTYGPHGKPYLKNYPYYFSISHSGDYVFCVLSQQEVGADIQKKAETVNERVLQRFFAPEEKAYWESCVSEAEKRDFFYKMWCRKEAYGKLTGEGIADAVSVNMCDVCASEYAPCKQYMIEEYALTEDYQIAICKWSQTTM